MKVKMFWVNEILGVVESDINEWLADQDIEIKHILQCADGANDENATTALVSIWYEEAKNED